MACFHPLTAYRGLELTASGKRSIVWRSKDALVERSSFKVGCGQCRGCRMDRSQQWAIRISHEASMHSANVFLTLTYSDERLPQSFSISKRELQLFMKRLRKEFGAGIKFFGCGEYGDDGGRPHYHLIVFGLDFSDKVKWAKRNGYQTWRSETLERLWPFGHSEIGSVTPESAGYVARYVLKKITGERSDDHYWRVSPVDGRHYRVEPEFALMSRRPALGATWLQRFKGDVFPSDFVIVDGRPKPVPRFYVRKLLEAEQAALKRGRIRKDLSDVAARARRRADNTRERLAVREEVHRLRTDRLKRAL